jgi:hypothetical protein
MEEVFTIVRTALITIRCPQRSRMGRFIYQGGAELSLYLEEGPCFAYCRVRRCEA